MENALACPRCSTPLFAGRAPDLTMHGCGSCGGVWLDIDGSKTALEGMSPAAQELLNRVTSAATRDVDKTQPVACPVCSNPAQRMQRMGAEIDVCGHHGTWFDRHELYKVSQAARASRAPQAGPPVGGYGFPSSPAPGYGPPPAVTPYAPSYAGGGGGSYSTWAIVGFVLSFFCGLLGLIFSIMGYNECTRSGGAIRGQGLATAGIIISVLSMILGLVLRAGR